MDAQRPTLDYAPREPRSANLNEWIGIVVIAASAVGCLAAVLIWVCDIGRSG